MALKKQLTMQSQAKGLVICRQRVGGNDVSKSDAHDQVELSPIEDILLQASKGLLVVKLPKLLWFLLCCLILCWL